VPYFEILYGVSVLCGSAVRYYHRDAEVAEVAPRDLKLEHNRP
jgi:hypothetical protein